MLLSEKITCHCLTNRANNLLFGGTAFTNEGTIKGALYCMNMNDTSEVSLSYLDESSSTVPNKVHCITEVKTGKEKVHCFLIGTDKFIFVASISDYSIVSNQLQLMQVIPIEGLGISGVHRILPDHDVIRFVDLTIGRCLVIGCTLQLPQERVKWWEKDPIPLGVLINPSPAKQPTNQDSPHPNRFTLLPEDYLPEPLTPKKSPDSPSQTSRTPPGHTSAMDDSMDSSTYTISVPDTASLLNNNRSQSSDMNIDSCLNFSLSRLQSKTDSIRCQPIVVKVDNDEEYRSFQMEYLESFSVDIDCYRLGYHRANNCIVINQDLCLGMDGHAEWSIPAEIRSDSVVYYTNDGKGISCRHRAGDHWKHSNNHGIHIIGNHVAFIVGIDIIVMNDAMIDFNVMPSMLAGVSYLPAIVDVGSDCLVVVGIASPDDDHFELRYALPRAECVHRSNLRKICKIELLSLRNGRPLHRARLQGCRSRRKVQ